MEEEGWWGYLNLEFVKRHSMLIQEARWLWRSETGLVCSLKPNMTMSSPTLLCDLRKSQCGVLKVAMDTDTTYAARDRHCLATPHLPTTSAPPPQIFQYPRLCFLSLTSTFQHQIAFSDSSLPSASLFALLHAAKSHSTSATFARFGVTLPFVSFPPIHLHFCCATANAKLISTRRHVLLALQIHRDFDLRRCARAILKFLRRHTLHALCDALISALCVYKQNAATTNHQPPTCNHLHLS